ncbi:MAG: hypothetical protein ACLQK4_06665 [Acidimicrobiales bacterium]|jgi:hypothetical protein
MFRTLGRIGAAAVVLALALGGVASATTTPGNKIGPNQWFAGMVNGKFDNVQVKVVCPISGKNGRALSGQTLSVTEPQVIAINDGYTGSKGHSIAALLGPSATSSVTIVWGRYNVLRKFPTNIPVPCSGTGTVLFIPSPASKTSSAASVTVSYANVAAG